MLTFSLSLEKTLSHSISHHSIMLIIKFLRIFASISFNVHISIARHVKSFLYNDFDTCKKTLNQNHNSKYNKIQKGSRNLIISKMNCWIFSFILGRMCWNVIAKCSSLCLEWVLENPVIFMYRYYLPARQQHERLNRKKTEIIVLGAKRVRNCLISACVCGCVQLKKRKVDFYCWFCVVTGIFSFSQCQHINSQNKWHKIAKSYTRIHPSSHTKWNNQWQGVIWNAFNPFWTESRTTTIHSSRFRLISY